MRAFQSSKSESEGVCCPLSLTGGLDKLVGRLTACQLHVDVSLKLSSSTTIVTGAKFVVLLDVTCGRRSVLERQKP